MKTGLHQHTSLRQDLRINPRLYQAMDLLYMPLLDLEQHLKQELLGNPFLEMIEPEEEVQATAAEQQQNKPEKEAKAEDGPDWENILLEDRTEHGVPSGSYSDAREYVEPVTVERKDLIDYLRDQTRMLDLNPRQQLLAEEFLGNIGEDGYLQADIEQIRKGANQLLEEHEAESELDLNVPAYTPAEVEAMLHVIQQLDPPGIGARNLRECLLLQLENQKRTVLVARGTDARPVVGRRDEWRAANGFSDHRHIVRGIHIGLEKRPALLKIPHLDVEKLRFGTSDTRVPVVVSIDNLCSRRSSGRRCRDRRTLMKNCRHVVIHE